MKDCKSFENFESFSSFVVESFSDYDQNISTELMRLILEEIRDSFALVELASSHRFENFWNQVDVQNTYEDDWEDWKERGIIKVYSFIWNEFKKSKFKDDVFI